MARTKKSSQAAATPAAQPQPPMAQPSMTEAAEQAPNHAAPIPINAPSAPLREPTPRDTPTRTDKQRSEDLEQTIAQMRKEMDERDAATKRLMDALLEERKKDPSTKVEVGTAEFYATVGRAIRMGSADKDGMMNDEYLDPADILDPPVLIFTNKSGWFIEFREEGGIRVPLPTGVKGPLSWKTVSREIEPDTMHQSYRGIMLVKNKRLLEWLKKDVRWNVMMFQDEAILTRQDKRLVWTSAYEMAKKVLMNREESWIMMEVARMGIKTNANTSNAKYREMIAVKMADEAIATSNQEADEAVLKGSSADVLLQNQGAGVEA